MRFRARLGSAVGVVCLGALLAACVPPKAPPPPPPPPPPPVDPFAGLPPVPPDQPGPPNSPTVTKTDLVTGLNNPWDMAFLPDGTMFFGERPGPVSVRLLDGTINHVVTPPDLVASSESGMLGLAVDPNYASNKFLYTCYGATGDVRVVRWTVNDTLNGVVGAGAVLVQGIPRGVFHFGCRIRFGPDGKLWITTGDNGEGTNPQNLSTLSGKVLRVNADGSAPSDNPFVGTPGDDRIYTFGHRNVQGIALQPGTGQPYSIEHGSDWDDEVNQLVAGGNGGWDPVPGYDQSGSMTDLAKFPDAMIPAWRSGFPTLAPSGGTFLTGPQWKSWEGALAVAFLKDSKARVMFLDGDGDVSSSTPFLELGTRLRSAVQGPDGNLYFSTDVSGGGAIWKVVPS
jgi:glucose/arabinose dehydrogenase